MDSQRARLVLDMTEIRCHTLHDGIRIELDGEAVDIEELHAAMDMGARAIEELEILKKAFPGTLLKLRQGCEEVLNYQQWTNRVLR